MSKQRNPDILVVGAAPVGLTLASELARRGIGVRIIDKALAPLPFCRAIGVTPGSLEVFEHMGLSRDLIEAGMQSMQLGRDKTPPHRLQDTQILVQYRSSPLAVGAVTDDIQAGDRVPDAHGLRR